MMISRRTAFSLQRCTLVAASILVSTAAAGEPGGSRNVLVVSGGISLGAYQAGATYSLLRHLANQRKKQPEVEFPVATGASAGNINAFLAALTWCDEDPDRPSGDTTPGAVELGPNSNLFFRTWVEIGIDRLSPDRDHLDLDEYRALFESRNHDQVRSVYTMADGLLTRNAFTDALQTLSDELGQPRFRNGCNVDLGITLTRAAPVYLDDRKQVLSQRFVVPFQAKVEEGWMVFSNFPFRWGQSHKSAGPRVAMPEVSGRIAFEPDLARLIQASAAFPVAFAAIPLDICEPSDIVPLQAHGSAPQATPGRRFGCPQRDPGRGYFVPKTVTFSDGGFFDNVPLGLAAEMAGPPDRGLPAARYWYVNSDIRRPPEREVSEAIPGNGLSFLKNWSSRGLVEARSYELQTLRRYRPDWFGFQSGKGRLSTDGGPSFRVIDRHPPLVGDYLMSFGAFANRSFRVYDYYAGVYDGMVNLIDAGPADPAFEGQFARLYRETLRPGGAVVDAVGEWIVQLLAAAESAPLKAALEREFPLDPHARCSLPVMVLEALQLIEEERTRLSISGNVEAVADFNARYDSFSGFWGFLELLGRRVRQAGACSYERRPGASPQEQRALQDLPGHQDPDELDTWTAAHANGMVRRLIELEKSDRAAGGSTALRDGTRSREPRQDPCVGDDVVCVRDLLPSSLDFVWRPSFTAPDAPRTDLVWKTTAFRFSAGDSGWGKHLLLRARYAHALAAEKESYPADRLSLGIGYAHGLEPTAFNIELGLSGYRFPAAGRALFSDLGSGLELSAEWLAGRATVQYLLGHCGDGGCGDRWLLGLGFTNLNIPFGWFFRRSEGAGDRTSDWSWDAQDVTTGATLLVPMLLERPQIRWDVFGFRAASSKARILAGTPWIYSILPALAPNHIDVDVKSGSVTFGYEPLRVNALGDRLAKGYFADVGVAVRRFLTPRGEPPDSRPSWQWNGSLGGGYDPGGRIIDDLRIAATRTYELNRSAGSTGGWHTGAEASVLLLGGSVRVGVALPKLFSAIRNSHVGATETMAVNLGFGDFDGLVAWILRWSLLPSVSDEHRKDG